MASSSRSLPQKKLAPGDHGGRAENALDHGELVLLAQTLLVFRRLSLRDRVARRLSEPGENLGNRFRLRDFAIFGKIGAEDSAHELGTPRLFGGHDCDAGRETATRKFARTPERN